MSTAPNKVIELKSNFCRACGSDIQGEIFVLKRKHQVVEIHSIESIYEEYQQYTRRCGCCGHQQIADFPSRAKEPIQYGSSMDTLVIDLSVYQSVPYNQLKKCFPIK